MTREELVEALLSLSLEESESIAKEVHREQMHKFYERLREQRQPLLEARWEADIAQYGESDHCREFSDGLDGFVLHTKECKY